MYKKIILAIGFIFSLTASAQAQYLQGAGKFLSKKGDGLSFIKEQLLFNANRSIIDQQLKNGGYQAQVFWERLDKSFKEHFQAIEEGLLKRYGGDLAQLKGEKRKQYLEKLRARRLSERKRFYGLNRVIKKWFVTKRLSRSARNPMYRMMSIKAMVDRNQLAKLYRKVTTDNSGESNYVLIITPNINLINVDWKENEDDTNTSLFTRVGEKWIEWFKKKKWDFFSEMKVMTIEQAQAAVGEWKDQSKRTDGKAYLWLKIDLSVVERRSDDFFKIQTLEYRGEYSLYDFRREKYVEAGEIGTRTRTYKVLSKKKFRSSIANFSYRYPLKALNKMVKSVGMGELKKKSEYVMVENVSKIDQAIELIELMNQQGIRLQVKAFLKQYSLGRSTLMLKYLGDEKNLEQFLQLIKNKSIATGHVIKLGRSGKTLILKKVDQT